MGAKDSKRVCLSYEDAVKRVSDAELKRINEAFKRLTGGGQLLMSQTSFVQHVLGDGVPLPVAGWLYSACGGGPRGIALKDLICGLVLLTKGTFEEKIRFLWTLYCNDSGTCIVRSDFQRALQLENSSTTTTTTTLTPGGQQFSFYANAASLFTAGNDRASFEEFRAWIGHNTSATLLSRWLLTEPCVSLASASLDTPTFYQTLAGVTHLEERDICDLEKCFWLLQSTSATGQLDLLCVSQLVSPPVPAAACEGLFKALDVNRDGHVDFKELCCGVSAACRGPVAERVKFCFKMFDLDGDGRLNIQESQQMLQILNFVAREEQHTTTIFNPITTAPKTTNDAVIQEKKEKENVIFVEDSESNNDPPLQLELSQEEFVIWGVPSASLVHPMLELLFQVCHVSLGLRPRCRYHERDIVLGWLDREERRGYKIGQFWYLVSSRWWRGWLNYTGCQLQYINCCQGCGPRPSISPAGGDNNTRIQPVEEGIACDESFTSNSTESMGDLLRGSGGDTCSIASSSGVSSSSGSGTTNTTQYKKQLASPPGPIDNSCLVAEPQWKVTTLTGEGGRLRRDKTLVQHRDFELIPDSLWKALSHWYGAPLPLPRQVIKLPGAECVDLELYPLNLRILRHQSTGSGGSGNGSGSGIMGAQSLPNTWGSVVGGYGAAALSSAGLTAPPQLRPTKYLAHTAAFSRLATVGQVLDFLSQRLSLRADDLRLWHLRDTHNHQTTPTTTLTTPTLSTTTTTNTNTNNNNSNGPLILLDDDRATLQDIGIKDGDQILLEIRNADLTWPEELGALVAGAKHQERATTSPAQIMLPAGATGLHNLGNTCFMNAALQAVSNTKPLTMYFRRDARLCELNQSNPLGTRGQVARRYAELCRELWTGTARSVAPLKIRWCVARHAPHLGGGGQHDSQELLAWLLDALHEDLNRVTGKRYTELSDSGGRPDAIVAAEAWKQHLARDHSIITDLFYGQLKSKVTCKVCAHESVRFDAFNVLSLPLPMDSYTLCEVLVIWRNGAVPVRYGVRLNSEARYVELKERLEVLCGIRVDRLVLVEVADAQIKAVLPDLRRVKATGALELMAYELEEDECAVVTGVEIGGGDDFEFKSSSSSTEEIPIPGALDASASAYMSSTPVASPEVSHTSALCMPNILCFKTTSTIRRSIDHQPLSTTALTLRHLQQQQPQPQSVTTVNDIPTQPPITTTTTTTTTTSTTNSNTRGSSIISYICGVHRKCVRQDAYFVAQHRTRHVLFGMPLLLTCTARTTIQQLYEAVWTQVNRLLSPLPEGQQHNHALDCDDSLGYEFPFTLRAVASGGQVCALCPWTKFCRGCALICGPQLLTSIYVNNNNNNNHNQNSSIHSGNQTGAGIGGSGAGGVPCVVVAIDWDPTALHLRYQSCREREWIEHESIKRCRRMHTEPVDLDHCLRAFTTEESLETKYHCSACNEKQPATKKLQIWRLPPILIIHLKRFDYVNGKWVKTHKVVNFPFNDFDPTAYLASVPQETIIRHRQLRNHNNNNNHQNSNNHTSTSSSSSPTTTETKVTTPPPPPPPKKQNTNENTDDDDDDEETIDELTSGSKRMNRRRDRLESTSLLRTPILDENLEDFHMHHLQEGQNPFDLKYQLYAVVSHSGMLNGGHYVSYACNPNGNWYCYNDSSCREVTTNITSPNNTTTNTNCTNINNNNTNSNSATAPRMDTSSAYILFYERSGLNYAPYLPDVPSGQFAIEDDVDDSENELRKQLCTVS